MNPDSSLQTKTQNNNITIVGDTINWYAISIRRRDTKINDTLVSIIMYLFVYFSILPLYSSESLIMFIIGINPHLYDIFMFYTWLLVLEISFLHSCLFVLKFVI